MEQHSGGRQLTLGESIPDYVDSHSNRWWLDPQTNVVHLKLASEEKSRRIGVKQGNRFLVKRVREKHLYRATDSYGFSSEILQGLGIEYVELTEDTGIFLIPLSVILENGEYIFHKKQGFEKQLFLPIRIITQYAHTPEMDLKRISLMGESWYKRLKPEFDKDYMLKLSNYTSWRRTQMPVYPEREDTFNALKYCSFESTKVIVLGQDL